MFLHLRLPVRLPGKFCLVTVIFLAILVEILIEILADSQVVAQVKPSFVHQQPPVVAPEISNPDGARKLLCFQDKKLEIKQLSPLVIKK